MLAEWFWVDRWTGSSAFGLSIEARGLYREMLSQAWRRGARLPQHHETIRRITGCTEAEWLRCWPLISSFWVATEDGNLVNETQLEVFNEALARQERASRRGQAGAQALLKHRSSGGQAPTQAQVKQVLKHQPPISDLRSPSPITDPHPPSVSVCTHTHAEPLTEELGERVREFIEGYQALFSKHCHGAKYYNRPSVDYQKACDLCATWPNDRLLKLAEVFLASDDAFIASGPRSIPHFASRASWADGKLSEWEAKNARTA